ncbi:hypothetical protein NLG97_g7170 [Lecanicillium saksenae]|uniref:Uncharacterized protein n=1 Tax=Lecanicillium saksenae TaxID=468837 RepID=A0ACC1QP63_9HYPO|nr:hypothetical protein NLG97_g7170 [Lecanicillium saksenae]
MAGGEWVSEFATNYFTSRNRSASQGYVTMQRLLYGLSTRTTAAVLSRRTFVTRVSLFITVTFILSLTLFHNIPNETKVLLLSKSSRFSCKPDRPTEAYNAACASRHDEAIIPNAAHFVYILSDTENGVVQFKFAHFLSVYSAWRYWKPDVMYLHTNVGANSSAAQGALSGAAGAFVHQSRQEDRADGAPLRLVRVKAIRDFGGIYIDLDVHALRDMKELREAGYDAVAGKQGGGLLNSGTFLSSKGSTATKKWIDSMHRVYDGRWTTHSNEALTTVASGLNSNPCEILVLDQAAFAPIGWKWFDGERLFGEHYSATGLERLEDDAAPLPDNFDDNEVGEKSPSFLKFQLPWTLDWSCTFLLHAFSRQMPKLSTPNNEITPRYIAQRRSLCARAVYPMLRDMYHNGVIDRHDFE